MPRILCLLLGLALASLPLMDATIRSDDPSPSDLTLARGGDPGQGKKSWPCGAEEMILIGCTQVGTCQMCVTQQPDGAYSIPYYDVLNTITPNGTAGYMNGQNPQDCGNSFVGSCVVDATASTGFKCIGVDSMNSCYDNPPTIVPQTDPIHIPVP